MDTTLDTFRALQAQCEHNASICNDELEDARKEGTLAAVEASKRGEMFMLMDENSTNVLQNAYAFGWNSVCPKSSSQ